jgi:hypothetical protein
VNTADREYGNARSGGRLRRRAGDESGQVLTIVALSMVMLIVCVGLVVDVGHAMLVQRQLQAGADAAALAGVQHLPDKPLSESVAMQYSATPASKNAVNTVNNATTVATAQCLNGVPGCSRRDGGLNGIVVKSTSRVPTWFGRIIGIDFLDVSAKATACAPCSVKPLDVMIVLDRTGSMCQVGVPPQQQNEASCTDLNAARLAIRQFATSLDPTLDKLGLALFPPTLDASWISSCPASYGYRPWDGTSNPNAPPGPNFNGKYYAYDQWWQVDGANSPLGENSSYYVVASLEGADGNLADDYVVDDPVQGWIPNPASAFMQRLGCTGARGGTSYSLSIESAQRELSRNGRGSVQDVIIFLSDGGANVSPTKVPAGHWTNNPSSVAHPCGTAVQAAANAKGSGTIIYTIGYDLAKNQTRAGTPRITRRRGAGRGEILRTATPKTRSRQWQAGPTPWFPRALPTTTTHRPRKRWTASSERSPSTSRGHAVGSSITLRPT